jgi:hypothetical protein
VAETAARRFDDGRRRTGYGIFLCECMRRACRDRLRVRNSEYQAIAAHPARFLVAVGHEDLDHELVVDERGDYLVVQMRRARHLRAVGQTTAEPRPRQGTCGSVTAGTDG